MANDSMLLDFVDTICKVVECGVPAPCASVVVQHVGIKRVDSHWISNCKSESEYSRIMYVPNF
jgi:hypothetical protein